MNKDVKIILERIHENFKRVPNTIYKINVVDDKFDKTYNFLFTLPREENGRTLSRCERLKITTWIICKKSSGIKEHYQLTFTYTGFIDYLDV